MLARVADGLLTHINGLDRRSTTLAFTQINLKRGLEFIDNQETQKELLITFLLLGTDKSCLNFSITTEVDLINVLFVLFLKSVQLQLRSEDGTVG